MTTTAATTTTTTGAAASADRSRTTVDYDSFLKLLTAQLRNQDPLAPMDATQFMTQLAQLSTVEQAMRTNDTLNQVLDTLKSSGMRMDMAFLGRTVEAASDTLTLSGGSGTMAYTVAGAPATIRIEVLDENGRTVHSAAAPAGGSGRRTFTWDGRRSDGSTAPDGLYTVRITARDQNGGALETAGVITGTVAEVRTVDGETRFVLKGGATVTADAILSAS
ncbi:flagellar hook assembly protein FlgD [Azospirillum halopraeferens]|uniref:flagellar hook assembly protein FlgD n=1 Tax=Azospirillum halopraeferens TaxID=34010 RepID=UPI0003FDE814|nr:flagellar hook assembly protein FlgD [Azospirillum halopraeferens]